MTVAFGLTVGSKQLTIAVFLLLKQPIGAARSLMFLNSLTRPGGPLRNVMKAEQKFTMPAKLVTLWWEFP